ncbi:UDP-N-acetylglucosamine 2-epimerase (non-hydrolyzing) [Micrococcus sp. EYE_162]|uniref:non-hydrolyzing UDP-N-acetylglucosamine 2-epimerase n=1 Tax=unclassified Micrococcus TaxID=2620948 RepID=UPI002006B275|nr:MULTISPECIES: UDP-N-acetylglucosamine 2-epimerase (non-hydrolyzing) [unclassified Micrococcus]MCK6095137.1 UDP-N-acetylglucosamine 2-epimerase (non-hydrolyzing) [Micrococcus sp. EYE_212]MCK6171084.1 UDP-N-acetylglucosamine 2-epimerase (non-hydrolyzing) [Micrococcus sp. EYE_162]
MSGRLKVMTVVGTRPEIIRLACVIRRLEKHVDHVLVHTGQNYDYNLNEVFFEDLGLRRPDHFLEADTSSLGAVLGDVLKGTERVLLEEKPDAMVVLGDTNSCVSALMGRRMKVPVFHLEAGNRSFDPNVPEEINRHLVDHVSDYNLVYTEHSRRNLLAEGLHPRDVMVMGSPMNEVLTAYRDQIDASDVLARLELDAGEYLLASVHREENVDRQDRLEKVLESLQAVAEDQGVPLLVSTHPRTRKRLEQFDLSASSAIRLHEPLGFHDYNKLQLHARCVISDSGTISEESSMLGFPAVTLRDAIERPEAIDTGAIIATGLEPADVVDAVRMVIADFQADGPASLPTDYTIEDSSRRVLNYIRSQAATHHQRHGIRR